jgi:hypothetical protein
VGAKPAEGGEGQHRRPVLRVGLDQQVSAVVVAKRKFRESDDHIPLMFVSLVSQSGQRSVHVLTSDRERLADHLEVPVAPILAVRRMKVAKPARNLSGLGRVSDEADLKRLHPAEVPTPLADTSTSADGLTVYTRPARRKVPLIGMRVKVSRAADRRRSDACG